jgi:hypothetical protein
MEDKKNATQGNKKIKQYLEDLRKNIVFQKRIVELKNEKSKEKRNALHIKLCNDFGIDWELFQNIRENESDSSSNWANSVDMCEVGFDFDSDFSDAPLKSKLEKELHKNAYPVSVDIYKFASKRDILDFIEKNWKTIESHLMFHRGKPKNFRQRKNERINEFIWKNKDLENKSIKKLLDNNFPGNGLVYNEIYDIIRNEGKRRSRKLT